MGTADGSMLGVVTQVATTPWPLGPNLLAPAIDLTPNPEQRIAESDVVDLRSTHRHAPAHLAVTPDLDFRAWSTTHVRTLVVSDVVLATGVTLLVLWGTSRGASFSLTSRAALMAIGFALALVLSLALARCYDLSWIAGGTEEVRRLGSAVVKFVALLAFSSYAFEWESSRTYLLLALPITVALLLAVRAGARVRLARLRTQGLARHRVLVLGTERASAELILRLHDHQDYAFVGVVTDAHRGEQVEGVPVLGGSDDLRSAVSRSGATTVLVASWSPVTREQLRKMSWELADLGVDFVLSPNLTDVASPRINVRTVGGISLLHIQEPEFRGVRRVVKGLFDRTLSLLALLILSPLLLIVAVLVQRSSEGSALYSHARVGRDGRIFTMYKFRSMYIDADERRADVLEDNVHADGPMLKVKDDPRVTPVGRWIRRYSIDELPQLLNVVRGDMSLVGPRPPLPAETIGYDGTVERKLLVRPGLTGLWQVSGRSDLSWDDSVRLDLHYVENWSVFLDLSILARTVSAVVTARGAY